MQAAFIVPEKPTDLIPRPVHTCGLRVTFLNMLKTREFKAKRQTVNGNHKFSYEKIVIPFSKRLKVIIIKILNHAVFCKLLSKELSCAQYLKPEF